MRVPGPRQTRSLQAARLTVSHKIITRAMKLLTRQGVLVEEEGSTYMADGDSDSDEARVLRPLQAAACTYGIAFGPRAGHKVLTVQGAERGHGTAPAGGPVPRPTGGLSARSYAMSPTLAARRDCQLKLKPSLTTQAPVLRLSARAAGPPPVHPPTRSARSGCLWPDGPPPPDQASSATATPCGRRRSHTPNREQD